MNIVTMDEKNIPISKLYLIMALPVVLSMVTTMIYNIADTWFIAATGNTNLIAGVSLGAPVLTLLMAFGNIYGQGGSSLVSRLIGKKDIASVRQVSAVCFYLAIATGIAAAAVMLLFRDPILVMLGSSEETIAYASQYYCILAAGAPVIVTSFIPNNLLRSEGMSKEAMIDSIGGVIINIILDPVFIFGCGLGAAGAALATVLGYLFVDIYAVIIILKKSTLLSVDPRKARTTRGNIGQIYGIGIPAAVMNIMQSFSVIFVNQFLLSYGNEQIAAMGVALKAALIGQLILVGLTFGALPLFGYYFGGNRMEKFRELLRFCLKFVITAALLLAVVLCSAARPLIGLFLEDASLADAGALMLRLQVVTLVFAGIVMLFVIVFQSMGRMGEMLALSVSRQGVIFLIVLTVMSRTAGYYGIIASQAIADGITAVMAIGLFLHWRKSYLQPKRPGKKGTCARMV